MGFWGSRLMHHKWMYKRFHKMHHEWASPVALTAIYCHPLEHITNLVGPALGPMLMQSHLATAWLWFALTIAITVSDHSGYHLPFAQSPEAHDYHHYQFNQFYGTLGLMDRLHGTDIIYRSSEHFRRHVVSFGFSPARTTNSKRNGIFLYPTK